MQNLDLKQLERKAWTSYFEDGLWDIFFGLMMLTSGVRSLTDNVWFMLGMVAAVLVLPIGKRLVTIPRIGRVRFAPERKRKLWKLRLVVFVSVLATFAALLLVLSGSELPARGVRAAIQGVGFTLVFGLMAYFMDFARMYVYGLLFATGSVLWELVGTPVGPIVFTVSGSASLLVGLVLVATFLRKYPKPLHEGSDVIA